jgi:hypothetical protein
MWNDKPDGYPIPAQNPMGTDTGMDFHPWIWICVQISIHNPFTNGQVIILPDSNPIRCDQRLICSTWHDVASGQARFRRGGNVIPGPLVWPGATAAQPIAQLFEERKKRRGRARKKYRTEFYPIFVTLTQGSAAQLDLAHRRPPCRAHVLGDSALSATGRHR